MTPNAVIISLLAVSITCQLAALLLLLDRHAPPWRKPLLCRLGYHKPETIVAPPLFAGQSRCSICGQIL